MSPVFAILRALSRAVRRGLGTFGSVKVNNFFLFVVLLAWGALNSGVEPASAEPFLVLIGALLLVPLSADPLTRIPRARMHLWPLSFRQRLGLRLASLMLSPVTWLTVAALAGLSRPGLALAFPVFALGVRSLGVPEWSPLRHVPEPPGSLGQLIRNNLRQMGCILDTYIALILCAAGIAYRFTSAAPEPEALPIFAILVAVAISTYPQCLFTLDGPGGSTRTRLLPLSGWQIVAAKDAAYLLVLIPLVAPLHWGAGLTFGLTALGLGRYTAVTRRLPVERWRFSSGRVLVGALQGVLGTALGMWEYRAGLAILALPIAAWGASLYLAGRYLSHDTVVRQ